MLSQRSKEQAILRSAADALLLSTAFFLAFAIRSYVPLPLVEPAADGLAFASHFWLLPVSIALFWALSVQKGLYARPSGASGWRTAWAVVPPFLLHALLLGTAIFLFQAKSFSRAVFFLYLGIGLSLLVVGKVFLVAQVRRGGLEPYQRNVLLVGANAEARRIQAKLEARPELGLRVVGHLVGFDETVAADDPSCLGCVDDLRRIVEERVVDDVVIALPIQQLVACEQQIAWCEEVGIAVHLKLDFVRTLFARTLPSELDGLPMLTVAPTPHDTLALLLKRGVDILGSAAGLVLLCPVIVACALAVRLSSRGPVIFSQERMGLNGRLFRLYKFRSMYRDAEARRDELASHNEMAGPVFKIRRDPRITPVGRSLRAFSLDEIPQLWNVLKGDMSLVGPRPPLPSEVRQYERWQRRRLSMRPGITCLWQVSGRNTITSFEDWMRLDLRYIDSWSLALDFQILLRTIPAVVLARGAQ